MLTRKLTIMMALVIAASAVSTTGCFQSIGPSLGIFSVPLPVTPYWQKSQEDKFHIHERYARVGEPLSEPIRRKVVFRS